MARRQRLSETQLAELFEPPTEQRELVRHYTLSDADLAAVRRCRGDHNRLRADALLPALPRPRIARQRATTGPATGVRCRSNRDPSGLHRRIPRDGPTSLGHAQFSLIVRRAAPSHWQCIGEDLVETQRTGASLGDRVSVSARECSQRRVDMWPSRGSQQWPSASTRPQKHTDRSPCPSSCHRTDARCSHTDSW